MSERHIQEAAGHVTSAAARFEEFVDEVRAAFRTGRLDSDPVGSSEYVRRLRDQAAVRLMAAHLEHSLADDLLASFAVRDANALVRALGYEPPEEPTP